VVEVRGESSNRNQRAGLAGDGGAPTKVVEVRGVSSNRNQRAGLAGDGGAQTKWWR
jgi:hypothetical protein